MSSVVAKRQDLRIGRGREAHGAHRRSLGTLLLFFGTLLAISLAMMMFIRAGPK
jgi:hypothetical protein